MTVAEFWSIYDVLVGSEKASEAATMDRLRTRWAAELARKNGGQNGGD